MVLLGSALLASAGCIQQGGLSNLDKMHLERAFKNHQVYARQDFVPENQYGIKLKDDRFLAGDPVRIVGIEFYLSDNLVRLSSEGGGKELYLKIEGRSAVELERNLLQFISFEPIGVAAAADSAFRATGHFHPRDHLQVLLPRTPLLAAAELDAPAKAVLAAGDRVTIRSEQRQGGSLWYEVEPVETGGMGWLSADWVSSPLFLYDQEDMAVFDRATDPDRLARFFRASLKMYGNGTDKSAAGWPAAVEEIVKLKTLTEGMETENVYRLLGPPDKEDITMVYTGAVEAERLDVWSYDAGGQWLQVRLKKNKVYNWRFVIERQ
jgi:hypothetical protein